MSTFKPRCMASLSVVFDGRGGSNSKPLLIDVEPKTARVSRNSYQEADTWSLEFDARRLPYDPEQIASVAARIYMWDELVTGGEWAVSSNEMIRGLMDEIDSNLVADEKVIMLTGRDYTGVMDPDWDPREKIPYGKPLDVTIQLIADKAAPANTSARFVVDFRATGVPPIVGKSRRSTKKKGLHVKPGKTYWDVIYDMCVAEGFIVYVDDSTIVIADPKIQTEATVAKAPRLAFGRHLETLRVSRRYAKERVPKLVCVMYDPKTKKRIEVKYPERRNEITTAIGLKKNEELRLTPGRGITDKDTLLRWLKMRFDLMARPETTYKFSTRHLHLGDASSSLFKHDTGDAISIAFDLFNREHLRSLNVGQRVEHLIAIGHKPVVATFVANNLDLVDQFKQPYYTKSVTYDWSVDDGIEIEFETVNFASERRERSFAA